MSEYQYHEFCRLNSPMGKELKGIMDSLSSRAELTTHCASYTYHYSDFAYEPIEILNDYFDMYFYVANFGCLRLAMKFNRKDIDIAKLQEFKLQDAINIIHDENFVIVDIDIGSEDGFGWIDSGKDIFAELLPIYDELKNEDFSFLVFAKALYLAYIEGENELLREFDHKQLPDHYSVVSNLFGYS